MVIFRAVCPLLPVESLTRLFDDQCRGRGTPSRPRGERHRVPPGVPPGL